MKSKINQKNENKPTAKRNQIRIIAGTLRGRKISFPDSAGLRPTPDRVKETLFNWLSPVIRGSRCLDLFAGSGGLSFEAISRGAKEVVALEKANAVFTNLKAQASALKIENLDILEIDSQNYLAGSASHFDIVFVDPPYGSNLLMPSLVLLHKNDWVKEKSLIYCGTDEPIKAHELPDHWTILRQQKAGVVHYYLLAVHQT